MDEIPTKYVEKNDLHDMVVAPAGGSYSSVYEDFSSPSSPSSKSEDSTSSISIFGNEWSMVHKRRLSGSYGSDGSMKAPESVDDGGGSACSGWEMQDDGTETEERISSAGSSPIFVANSTSKLEFLDMAGSSKLHEESQIIQTSEALISKVEIDRTKRFEYLLKQTEIWGHFMQPAYVEALSFTEENTNKSSSSKSDSPQDLPKKKIKAPHVPIPIAAAASSSKYAPKYVTHFNDSPTFIEGGSMRDYQVRGLNWMISLYEKGLSGILADEMGLGKTIQAISLLGYLKHYRAIDGPHLIIAPKSTLPNWMKELKKWCPTLKAICLIGSKEERPSLIRKKFLPKRWNVCVTSYEMAKIEKATLAKVNYHYIIIDEAQKIKNENSLLATCVRQFKSSIRLLLTGTPLQNNLHELWALLNFLLPDVFSSSEDFDSWFNESNCIGNQMVDRLHAVLRPFLLRRIKSDVEKSLPPKTEMRIYVQMSDMQRDWYRKILLNDIKVISSTTGRPTKANLQNIIMHLRKVCNHPYLFEGAEPKPFTTDTHLVTNCGKMIVLDKLLLKLKAQQSRVLLFSQMTRMLDILEDYCIWRDFEYCRLDGNTDYDIRQEDIDEFNAPNSSKFIYLLSTRAGGLGINLASANIVIIYDSDWNPQMDLQAMDRAHRIGQTKEVKVFRFVVQDSAEEKIVERAAAKLHLDKMVIQQGRLVGADVAKGPTSVELMSVVRFGAEKILKSGITEGISDADIDTILAQSKLRSEELDRRLNTMTDDNLRELTIEHVELSYEQKPVDGNYTFLFEGQNYRELRKRKQGYYDENEQFKLDGKRRKENLSWASGSTNNDDGSGSTPTPSILHHDSDASFVVSDSESAASKQGETEEKLMKKLIKSQVRKPMPPLDYHFCPPYIWELYWRRLDHYKNVSEDFKDAQILKSTEISRLKKCNTLSSIESREILMLKSEGFSSWKEKHFKQFLKAMSKNGPDNLVEVAKAIPDKDVEEVVSYSQVFWLRCQELANCEKVLLTLGRPQVIKERRTYQQNLLNNFIPTSKSIMDVKVKYEPYHWRGQRFGVEDDAQLLMSITEVGMLTPDVFGALRNKLARNETCSAFLRTRTKEDLLARFNLLMYFIDKESKVERHVSPKVTQNSKGKSQDAKELLKVATNTNVTINQETDFSTPKSKKAVVPKKKLEVLDDDDDDGLLQF